VRLLVVLALVIGCERKPWTRIGMPDIGVCGNGTVGGNYRCVVPGDGVYECVPDWRARTLTCARFAAVGAVR
jgi:hypothetical protein